MLTKGLIIGGVRLNADMIIRLSQALGVSSDAILGISHKEAVSPVSLNISQQMRKIEILPAFEKKALLKTIDNALKGAGIGPDSELVSDSKM